MDINAIIELIKQHAPMVVQHFLMALGGLVVLGRCYVFITPNKNDDEWLQSLEGKSMIGHLLMALVAFSPVQRVEKK